MQQPVVLWGAQKSRLSKKYLKTEISRIIPLNVNTYLSALEALRSSLPLTGTLSPHPKLFGGKKESLEWCFLLEFIFQAFLSTNYQFLQVDISLKLLKAGKHVLQGNDCWKCCVCVCACLTGRYSLSYCVDICYSLLLSWIILCHWLNSSLFGCIVCIGLTDLVDMKRNRQHLVSSSYNFILYCVCIIYFCI